MVTLGGMTFALLSPRPLVISCANVHYTVEEDSEFKLFITVLFSRLSNRVRNNSFKGSDYYAIAEASQMSTF